MSALAMVTSLSPAISLAPAMPSKTPLTKVVCGHIVVSWGASWVTTTTGAPIG